MNLKQEIGKRIRLARHTNGLNQQQVASLLNISIPAFSKIETGVTDINITRLQQIADVFKRPVTSFICDVVEYTTPTELIDLRALNEALKQDKLSAQSKLIELYEEIRSLNAR